MRERGGLMVFCWFCHFQPLFASSTFNLKTNDVEPMKTDDVDDTTSHDYDNYHNKK